MRMLKPNWFLLVLSVSLLLVLVGCAKQTADDKSNTPPQTKVPAQTQKPAPKETPKPTENESTPTSDKTDEMIQAEIREKLGRMTHPPGYVLPTDSEQRVQGVSNLADVTELLRKKGYSIDLARILAQQFYQEHSSASGAYVTVIATDGYPGPFDLALDATFTRKNKYTWTVAQKHSNDALYGPHIATYDVEVLKDGTYRLNAWTAQKM